MPSAMDIAGSFILMLMAMVSTTYARTTVCGGNPADVIFILDASNSIWNPDFHHQLTFVQNMVDQFLIGDSHVRVAVITFANHPRVEFHLNTFNVTSRLKKGIGRVRQIGGSHTHTDRAIRLLRKLSLSRPHGARPSLIQVGIIITDGRSDNRTATILEAAKARELGIHLFAIGVGYRVDRNELLDIASLDQYVHTVQSYQGLDDIKELLAIKTCTVTDPPTTTESTTPLTTTTTRTTPSTTTASTTPTTTTRRTTPTTTTTTTTTTKKPTTTTSTTTTTTTLRPTRRSIRTRAPPDPIPSILYERDRTGDKEVNASGVPDVRLTQFDDDTIVKIVEKDTPNAELSLPPDSPNKNNDIPAEPQVPSRWKEIDIGEPQACVIEDPTDLLFVIDEKKGGPETMKNIWKFIRKLVNQIDMSNGNLKIKFIHECIDVPEMQLGEYRNKTALLSALAQLSGHPRKTPDLLHLMSQRLLDGHVNSVEPHHKIGVYITDAASGNMSATLNEAQTAKLLHNIELFGIGIGNHIDPTELRALVSCEVDKHLHMVIKPEDLQDVVRLILDELCKDRRNLNHQVDM